MHIPDFSRNYYVVLLFKDDLPESTGKGFPLVAESPTVVEHRNVIRQSLSTGKQTLKRATPTVVSSKQIEFFSNIDQGPQSPNEVSEGSCVWGWWRKPWECHPELLERLLMSSKDGKSPYILLYNQYLMRVYRARLRAIYYKPYLTTVEIPVNWRVFCPEYYRNKPRLCGAFLSLEIDLKELRNAKELFSHLFIDSASFELAPQGMDTVMPAPEAISNISADMIDKPMDRAGLRNCEHTMILVRKFRQKEYTKLLLESFTPVKDNELDSAFIETAWNDIQNLLSNTTPLGWKNLSNCPKALSEIGNKAVANESRITRLDLELFAKSCACRSLRTLLIKTNGKKESFTELGQSLRLWVASSTAPEARRAASSILRHAWNAAGKLYGLSDLPDYFERLPAMEAVASAVRHEIGKKFYRDHLSHNVRVALFSAQIVDRIELNLPEDVDPYRIAFFSGLFHDIAFPVSAFPDTIEKLAKALNSIQICDEHFRAQRLLDTNVLKKGLSYVVSLASVPDLLVTFKQNQYCPWDKPDESIAPVDKRLMQELLLCANSEEHAFIGSAILFDRAVAYRATGNDKKYDAGLKTLMQDMTGHNANPQGRELLSILQCIAIHDRKPAIKYHGVRTSPHNSPVLLSWERFELPVIMSIGDEMQEWGRPVGSLDGIGVIDANISLNRSEVKAEFKLTSEASTFTEVPYSLFEALFGKLRVTGRICYKPSPEENEQPMKVSISLENLKAFCLDYVAQKGFELGFLDQFTFMDIKSWPKEVDIKENISGRDDQHLVSIKPYNTTSPGHDYIIFSGNTEEVTQLVELAKHNQRISRLHFNGEKLMIESIDGKKFCGDVLYYWFGNLDASKCIPTRRFPLSDSCALLQITLFPSKKIVNSRENFTKEPLSLLPHPHILDYDWRFTVRTAKWIVGASRYYTNGGQICYLGCPTLALLHQRLWPEETNWVLLDRGHYALDKWINSIIPKERFIPYDVFEPLRTELIAKYSLVVIDPPWYVNEYKAFCHRAVQLVKDGGFICVSNYPPFSPYKQGKHDRFKRIIREEFGKCVWLGSFEIDYEIPEFERSWAGQKQFQHAALNVYRPAYMDLFHLITADRSKASEIIDGQEGKILPSVYPLENGHYLRYVEEDIFPCTVVIQRRKKVNRMKSVDPKIIAWSTKNTLIRVESRGQEVRDLESLHKAITNWETKRKKRDDL